MTAVSARREAPRSAVAHFEAFCASYCRHTKGPQRGEPLAFEPWQRRAWREALRLDKDGKRIYQFVLQGRPRKNYKTTECAALGLYLCGPDGEPGPEVAIGSGSRGQAGLVFNQARDFVDVSAELQRVFIPQVDAILAPALHGVLSRVSSEGRLQMGLNLSGAVLDELHVFQTERERMLYSALVTASGIREQPFVTSITTAGWDLHSLLGELYSSALKLNDVERFGRYEELTIARDLEAGFLMIWYGAPEGSDIENRKLWRAVNPGRAVRMDYLERQFQSPHVSEGEFARYHLNQWRAAKERWIADHVWRAGACELEPQEGQDVYLAVDAALTYDTTALDMAFPVEDDPAHRVLHIARVWSARGDVAHDVLSPGRIDLTLVEEYVISIANRFRVRELVYDPRYFEDTAMRLAKRGVAVAPMQPGTKLMSEATDRFYLDCQDGKVLHLAGEQGAVLTQHVEAAVALKTENGWRLSKLRATRPIDALVAMLMAHSRAIRRSESVYERRGLAVLETVPDVTRPRQRPEVRDEEDDW